jgi:NMD protein affecting ribosome stability and mRNA decay
MFGEYFNDGLDAEFGDLLGSARFCCELCGQYSDDVVSCNRCGSLVCGDCSQVVTINALYGDKIQVQVCVDCLSEVAVKAT